MSGQPTEARRRYALMVGLLVEAEAFLEEVDAPDDDARSALDGLMAEGLVREIEPGFHRMTLQGIRAALAILSEDAPDASGLFQ